MSKARKSQRSDTSAKARFNSKPHKIKNADKKGEYLGIAWESFEELSFLYWAEELKKQGYIHKIERAPSFLLCDALANNYAEQLKTKSKPVTQTLHHGHSYTPEFTIYWNYKKARDKFVWLMGSGSKFDKLFVCHKEGEDYKTIVEVKPVFDMGNMTRLVKINIKWVYQRYGIFVNLVKPAELFERTFVPKKYMVTTTGKQRKLKFKPTSLFDFLNNK